MRGNWVGTGSVDEFECERTGHCRRSSRHGRGGDAFSATQGAKGDDNGVGKGSRVRMAEEVKGNGAGGLEGCRIQRWRGRDEGCQGFVVGRMWAKGPDIVKWKFGDDRCFGLHGSSGSLSGSSVIISTEVRVSRRTLFGGSVMIAVMGYTDAQERSKGTLFGCQ